MVLASIDGRERQRIESALAECEGRVSVRAGRRHRNQLLELQVKPTGLGVELRIAVDKTALRGRVNERRRSMPGRTGCGLCGVHGLEEAIIDLPRVAQGEPVRSTARTLSGGRRSRST